MRDYGLLCICRHACALHLGDRIAWHLRWNPSEYTPADRASRLRESEAVPTQSDQALIHRSRRDECGACGRGVGRRRAAPQRGAERRTLAPRPPHRVLPPALATSDEWAAPARRQLRSFSIADSPPSEEGARRPERAGLVAQLRAAPAAPGGHALGRSLSHLECRAIGPRTSVHYQRGFGLFLSWFESRIAELDMALLARPLESGEIQDPEKILGRTAAAALGAVLVHYLDHLYFSGNAVGDAEKTRVAVVHLVPHLGSHDLPRTARPLVGFRKVTPGRRRLPMPKLVMLAIVGWLYVTYARPWESIEGGTEPRSSGALTSPAVILCPRERLVPSKTQQLDDTILLRHRSFRS